MSHDWPELPDLVLTVREFLDDLVTRLDGQDRYHALCEALPPEPSERCL